MSIKKLSAAVLAFTMLVSVLALPAGAAEVNLHESKNVDKSYILVMDDGVTIEFHTLNEIEQYLYSNIASFSSLGGTDSHITPYYVPCGHGQHGGPFTFVRGDNVFFEGKLIATYYWYRCGQCGEVILYDKKFW